MGTLKKYVKNKVHLEGSIAKEYVINEALTYYSMYLHGIKTRFNRPEHNRDSQGHNKSTLSIFTQLVTLFGSL